jgi:hypothetical protein
MRALIKAVVIVGGIALLGWLGMRWIFGEMRAEGESGALAGAYRVPLDRVLAEYAWDHPRALSARTGFFSSDPLRGPCPEGGSDLPPQAYPSGLGCTAVGVTANTVHPWVQWLVPHRVLIRVSAPVWADPAARQAILNTIKSRAAPCSMAPDEGQQRGRAIYSWALSCSQEQDTQVRVYIVGDGFPFAFCHATEGALFRGKQVTGVACKPRSSSDPHAILVSVP